MHILLVSLFVLACSTSPPRTVTGPATVSDAKPTTPKRKPHGWQGYSGKRSVDVDSMGAAKDAIVLDQRDKPVHLSSFWQDSKALIVFFRGHWWPDCRQQLVQLHSRFDELNAANLRVVALSVDPPATNAKTAKRLNLSRFQLYTDSDGKAAQAWKVWDANTEIALAATFIVDKGGTVRYRFVGADKADRPDVDALLKAAE